MSPRRAHDTAPGATVWFTGLPAAGKSTLARNVAERLRSGGRPACVLDGDDLRTGLCSDLGFSVEDRCENVRRVGEVSKLFAAGGGVAVVALVSPFRAGRERVRELHERAGLRFLEVFINTPLPECERRDPKGLFRRARAGELTGLTGIDSPYEPPLLPELEIGAGLQPPEAAEAVIFLLIGRDRGARRLSA